MAVKDYKKINKSKELEITYNYNNWSSVCTQNKQTRPLAKSLIAPVS